MVYTTSVYRSSYWTVFLGVTWYVGFQLDVSEMVQRGLWCSYLYERWANCGCGNLLQTMICISIVHVYLSWFGQLEVTWAENSMSQSFCEDVKSTIVLLFYSRSWMNLLVPFCRCSCSPRGHHVVLVGPVVSLGLAILGPSAMRQLLCHPVRVG